MIRKTALLIMLTCIVLLSPATVFADGYTLNDGEASLEIGSDWEVYTRDNYKDAPVGEFDDGYIHYDPHRAVSELFESPVSTVEIVAFPPEGNFYLIFGSSPTNELEDGMTDYSCCSDEELMSIFDDSFVSEDGSGEMNDIETAVYEKDGYKFLVVDSRSYIEGSYQINRQYMTAVGGVLYIVSAVSLDADPEIQSRQKDMIKEIIDAFSFTRPPVPESDQTENADRSGLMSDPLIWFVIIIFIIIVAILILRSGSRRAGTKR